MSKSHCLTAGGTRRWSRTGSIKLHPRGHQHERRDDPEQSNELAARRMMRPESSEQLPFGNTDRSSNRLDVIPSTETGFASQIGQSRSTASKMPGSAPGE